MLAKNVLACDMILNCIQVESDLSADEGDQRYNPCQAGGASVI